MTDDLAKKREDEWFLKNERDLIDKIRQEREERLRRRREQEQAEELERLRRLHWLKCPKCGHDMTEIELDRVHVDKCTFCEGIFFDRGELEDLLTARAAAKKSFFRRLLGLSDE